MKRVPLAGDLMKCQLIPVALIATLLCSTITVAQTGKAIQTLTLEVRPTMRLTVSGNPQALMATDEGTDPSTVMDKSTRYDLLTNLEHLKIVASISHSMPPGTQLMIHLASTRGISLGMVDVSHALSPVEVVTGIGKGTERDQAITYVFAVNRAARIVDTDSRVVVLTLSE